MSNEFRKAMLNRLPAPATRAPWAEPDEDEDEAEELDDLGDLGPRPSGSSKLTPLSAAEFFQQALEVDAPGRDATFRVYLTAPVESQAGASSQSKKTYLVAHHGAGASGLSFAPLAKEVARVDPELGMVAFDARGHGKTRADNVDLSLDTLTADLVAVIEHMFPDPAVSLLLVGHSMGAAPILAAAPLLQAKGYTVPGVVVLDVVEGTAVEALPRMKGILDQRPTSFPTLSDALNWNLSLIHNVTSVRVSVPSYVVPGAAAPDERQTWRIDLAATEPHWLGWYTGLSNRFISARCARMLVLAGQERLDRDLMVGQMQGKFQLEVMHNVGHYLHEDDPATLAQLLVTFWRRNTRVLVLPPKIGSAPVAVKHVGEV